MTMRVVITGASGNVGTSLLNALAGEPEVDSILGIARRRPAIQFPKTSWAEANVATDDLEPLFAGTDAIVHLAWLIQPSRDERVLQATNVEGSRRVFEAAARAGVRTVVYASSVGAYSPGPKDRPVDESWPTDGIESSFYARHKAAVERLLDRFELDHPSIRVVRLRPGLIFKREAATEIRRLFAGPLLPGWLARRSLIQIVPDVPRLRFQAVHSLDVGDAYRRALVDDVRGAFNIAAEPVLDPSEPAAPARSSAGVRASARARRCSSCSPECARAAAWRRPRSLRERADRYASVNSRRASAVISRFRRRVPRAT
jgi:nucleoside-diphosphate-sugar epimerase